MSVQPADSVLLLVRGYSPPDGWRVSGRLFGPACDLSQWRTYYPPDALEVSAVFGGLYSAPDAHTVAVRFAGVATPESPLYRHDATEISFALPRDYTIASPPLVITLPPDGRLYGAALGALPFGGAAIARYGVRATASGAVPLSGGAIATTENGARIANALGTVPLGGAAIARHGVRAAAAGTLPITLGGSAQARHGVRAIAAGAIPLHGSAPARHGVRAVAQGALPLSGVAGVTHARYEVRGEVRLSPGGLLVQRHVRVYARDTGALVAAANSVGGYFRVACALEPAEYVVLPIDLSPDATDFVPPVANRVLSVLAQDAWR